VNESRSEEAAERRARAERRATELEKLRARLARGEPVTDADVELAAARLDEATDDALAAHQHAAEAHHRAATAHRQAALIAERAGRRERAAEHLIAADADDSAAEVDEAG
jgi:hypothetical protein